MDLNTLINLGVLGVLGFLVRAVYETRGDVRVIKATLGINGSGNGLIKEVQTLREAKHDHANMLATLMAERELNR